MSEAAVIELIGMLEAQPQPSDEDWHSQAVCSQTDPEAFYPEKGGSTREAKRICRECPVLQQCRQWAIDHDERYGVWGGLSERERRRLKRDTESVEEPLRLPSIAAAAQDDERDARLAG